MGINFGIGSKKKKKIAAAISALHWYRIRYGDPDTFVDLVNRLSHADTIFPVMLQYRQHEQSLHIGVTDGDRATITSHRIGSDYTVVEQPEQPAMLSEAQRYKAAERLTFDASFDAIIVKDACWVDGDKGSQIPKATEQVEPWSIDTPPIGVTSQPNLAIPEKPVKAHDRAFMLGYLPSGDALTVDRAVICGDAESMTGWLYKFAEANKEAAIVATEGDLATVVTGGDFSKITLYTHTDGVFNPLTSEQQKRNFINLLTLPEQCVNALKTVLAGHDSFADAMTYIHRRAGEGESVFHLLNEIIQQRLYGRELGMLMGTDRLSSDERVIAWLPEKTQGRDIVAQLVIGQLAEENTPILINVLEQPTRKLQSFMLNHAFVAVSDTLFTPWRICLRCRPDQVEAITAAFPQLPDAGEYALALTEQQAIVVHDPTGDVYLIESDKPVL